MAGEWKDYVDPSDLANWSRATQPLSNAGYDPSEVATNPELRQQVMQQVSSPYGLQAASKTATAVRGAVNTPSNAAIDPQAPQAASVAVPKPTGVTSSAVSPSGNTTRSLGVEALQHGLSAAEHAENLAEGLASSTGPDTQALEAQRAKDANPTPFRDTQTGEILDQYKPSFGQRVLRGVQAFAKGGIPAVLNPAEAGATPYGAPNNTWQAQETARQGRLAADDTQIKNIQDRFKEMTEARKGAAGEMRQSVTGFKDVAQQAGNLEKNEAALREHGLKLGEDGTLTPLPYEEMTPGQQADYDLKQARQELADATADWKKAQNDPNSPAYKLAYGRLMTAQQNANSKSLTANAYNINTYAGVFGRTPDGTPVAGANLTDTGNTVGYHFASNVRPTGVERNKADMARSADEQLSTIEDILRRRQDIFGPTNGRVTDFKTWVGSQDPDAQTFRAARTIAGDHLAGTFGGRSEAALDALDTAIGRFKDNPQAALAGIRQLRQANNRFIQAGTVRTVDNNAAPSAKPAGNVPAATSGAPGNWFGQHTQKK